MKPSSVGGLAKSWAQRVRIGGRPNNVGLGSYPLVTLAEARAKALQNARAIAQGHGPRTGGIPTFADAAEQVITLHEPTWRNGARSAEIWRSSLRTYAFPTLGKLAVDQNHHGARARGSRAALERERRDHAAGAPAGSRMKAGRSHRVPLSTRALEALADARELSDGSELIFPSVRGKVLSDMTISKLVPGLVRRYRATPRHCGTGARAYRRWRRGRLWQIQSVRAAGDAHAGMGALPERSMIAVVPTRGAGR